MSPYALTRRNLEIRDNFDAIAPRYDLTNRVISLGIDLRWRKVAIRALADLPPRGRVLDLACGTCDLARELLRQRPDARVVGADLSRAMLGLARAKVAALETDAGGDGPIRLVNAPAEALPFRDGAFDAVTIGFGIRNVPEHRLGLREMHRVLRPGGRAVVLEFSTPPSKLLWKAYNYYFFHILPRIGGWLTGREAAYRYLTDSVSRFPSAPAFKADMEEAGFAQVTVRSMQGGIVCVHTGIRR
ncbi:MAG TPA: bifunctional demethylmenaquinone methyltransferase/2-methoxy-6-polyprenyl-1,4-benzoquinol methylase UbiE [Candidatus Polarisedimenticolia bacterium]